MPESKKKSERLTRLFEKLNEKKILACENFTCCNSCGTAEITDMLDEEEEYFDYIGYCFYHVQDRDYAVEKGKMCLSYGCKSDFSEKDIKHVAKIIYKLCKKYKLKPKWDGSIGTRIEITLPESVIKKFEADIEKENIGRFDDLSNDDSCVLCSDEEDDFAKYYSWTKRSTSAKKN